MRFHSHPDSCGCCEGTEALTPLPVANRPGLPALSYRVGTHSTFLETMLARLSSLGLEVDADGQPVPWRGGGGTKCGAEQPAAADPCAASQWDLIYPLRGLSARGGDDPSIALLDAWALVADVLTFYQERIANEGYLRTAVERRSAQELARLVGYKLRPGVAASVYLAFTLDKDYRVRIPAGTRAQSVPQGKELPQPFETMEALDAREAWNAIPARRMRPQYIARENLDDWDRIYVEGLSTQLRPNDPLLFVFGNGPDQQVARFVKEIKPVVVIEPIPGAGYTIVRMQPRAAVAQAREIAARYLNVAAFSVSMGTGAVSNLAALLRQLGRATSTEGVARAVTRALPAAQNVPVGAGQNLRGWMNAIAADLTTLSQALNPPAAANPLVAQPGPFPFLAQAAAQVKAPAQRPASGRDLARDPAKALGATGDTVPKMLTALHPRLDKTFYAAWGSAQAAPDPELQQVAALRVKAAPFGSAAPPMPILDDQGATIGETEWPLGESEVLQVSAPAAAGGGGGGPVILAMVAASAARVTVKTGGATYSGLIPLVDDAELSLPPTTVRLTRDDGRFTFDFVELGRQIELQADDQTVTISVDGGQVAELAMNQSTVVERGQRRERISAFNQPGGMGVTAERLSAPQPRDVIVLDSVYDQITPGSWVLIDREQWREQGQSSAAFQVLEADTVAHSAYRLSGKATRLRLSGNWLSAEDLLLSDIRSAQVYAQSEPLTLVDERYDDPVAGDTLELDGLYDGLESGRWIFVSGERTDIPGATGVTDVELAMIANVRQGPSTVEAADGSGPIARPGDKAHTTLELTQPLDHTYARQTVVVYANVVKATHGETRREVLGSGDAAKSMQTFSLRQAPLTYVPAGTPAGAASTLEVRVNDVRWPEVDSLLWLGASDRGYELRRDDDGEKDLTTVVTGDGRAHGARPPTAAENITAVYRSGLGAAGNVAAGTIGNLIIRPLGVRGVKNPEAATGGADRDDRDAAKRNAPLAVAALDRLVSAQDYADFARMFAGIGKATATVFPQPRGKLAHVTVAGAGNSPLDANSEVLRNLNLAMRHFGDPLQPFEVAPRELLLLIVSAKVRIHPDYRWSIDDERPDEPERGVEPQIRKALRAAFGFERRELGQDVYASEIIATIHRVPGVAYVDLDFLGSVSETEALDPNLLAAKLPPAPLPDRPAKGIEVRFARRGQGRQILPAQLAILSADAQDTLILTELA